MSNIDLRVYAHLFKEYTELRAQENRSVSVALVKGNLTSNVRQASGGVSARVCKGGSWGFTSNPEVTPDSIAALVRTATDNAVFLDSRENKGAPPLPSAPAVSSNDFSTKKTRLDQKALVDFVRDIDAHILATYPGLSSRSVGLSCLDMEKTLVTSDGTDSFSMIPRSTMGISLSVMKDDAPVDVSKSYGGLGQFEDVFGNPSDLYQGIEVLHEHLMKKAEGVYAAAGLQTCVLDADMAGILAHEAIGHTTEADLVMMGSVAGPLLGKEAASPLITLVDFANEFRGKTCPVPVYIDDEGTLAKDAVIIEDGVLRSYMHNKESAVRFGVEPTGNARAYQFSDEPLIRMRNTAIVPGSSSLADMIASVDDGYYLIRPTNGQADMTSEFMFGVSLGYEIKNGKLGHAIKDTTISGIAFDVLRTVTMVSSDMNWSCAGMCGKKQMIPVGMGGPAVKCKVNIGGR